MHGNGWEVALSKELVQLGSTDGALDENDDLVELEIIKKLIQLSVLLALLQLDVVLLQTVQSELGVFIDIVLCGVLHELAADGLDGLGESGREHHDLLLLRSGAEHILHVGAHIFFGVRKKKGVISKIGRIERRTHRVDRASCHTRQGRRYARFPDGGPCHGREP